MVTFSLKVIATDVAVAVAVVDVLVEVAVVVVAVPVAVEVFVVEVVGVPLTGVWEAGKVPVGAAEYVPIKVSCVRAKLCGGWCCCRPRCYSDCGICT